MREINVFNPQLRELSDEYVIALHSEEPRNCNHITYFGWFFFNMFSFFKNNTLTMPNISTEYMFFFQPLLQNQVLWIQMTNNHQGKQWFAQEVVRLNLFQSEAIHWPATSPSKLWSQDHSGSSQISTPPVFEKKKILREGGGRVLLS